MVVDSTDLVNCLLSSIVEEFGVDWIQSVAVLELAPKQYTHLVGEVVHEVWGIGAAGPYSQHVLVPINHGSKELLYLLGRNPRPKRIRGNEIASLGVEFVAVDLKVPWD